jgi:hypothetical protein
MLHHCQAALQLTETDTQHDSLSIAEFALAAYVWWHQQTLSPFEAPNHCAIMASADAGRAERLPIRLLCVQPLLQERLAELQPAVPYWDVLSAAGLADCIVSLLSHPHDGPMRWHGKALKHWYSSIERTYTYVRSNT